jgi:hypothetical protein
MMESRVVNENKIHTIYVCMIIFYFHILSKQNIFSNGAVVNISKKIASDFLDVQTISANLHHVSCINVMKKKLEGVKDKL